MGKFIEVEGIKYELLEDIRDNMREVIVKTSTGNVALLSLK